MATDTAFIGIDWGTTNLRVWRLTAQGDPLDSRASPQGMGSLSPAQFAPVLDDLLSGWPTDLPVLACGMAGARQGWVEAPYVPLPADAPALAHGLVAAPGDRRVLIVPGIAARDAQGHLVDVARGEETQAIGAAAPGPGLLVCPGTHSKWIRTDGARIMDLQTFMTGELNGLLAAKSVLRHSIGGPARPDAVFRQAVTEMLEGRPLPEALFSVRVQSLDDRLAAKDAASRLSGLVIGAEIAAGAARFGLSPVRLVGNPLLVSLYAPALAQGGYDAVEVIDGDHAVCRGLAHIWNARP
ncbi:2-dehydro-3-deoxygalactonokinase [Brevundimonas sp.]|uniref:2-dehydro-3-deoxygalactonokinase n=1 Tax=Brevundimonas sp. TaxID=1871086 RepID=UPI002ABA11CE|nr:2-dehydro-3-deoxygalactonokinase [Brevundimonas sp.]MDZ4362842.1 2-dehydro-3-deoxygalactonokinase [Brevundimonas sp.]